MVLDNISFDNSLINDTLDVFRLDPAIPHAMASQWVWIATIVLPCRRNIHNDVARKFVSTDMTNETNTSSPRRIISRSRKWRRRDTLVQDRAVQHIQASTGKLPLKFCAKSWTHDATPHVTPAVAADEHHYVGHVTHAV